MEEHTLGDKIREARKSRNLSQVDLAFKCRLDVRTIQRIESGEVNPRAYTLRIINSVLETDFIRELTYQDNEEILILQKTYEKKRKIRIIMAISVVIFLILVGIASLNNWHILGMAKKTWVPLVYVIMFAYLIVLVQFWRCPGCNGILGDVTNTRYCSKCGLQLR
jgi:transcriptional regulator with XRE-family HTH domain